MSRLVIAAVVIVGATVGGLVVFAQALALRWPFTPVEDSRPMTTPAPQVPVRHAVDLPHPGRDGQPQEAVCSCGDWSTEYVWGRHEDAAYFAGLHVREAAKCEPVEARIMDGTITVLEGRSL